MGVVEPLNAHYLCPLGVEMRWLVSLGAQLIDPSTQPTNRPTDRSSFPLLSLKLNQSSPFTQLTRTETLSSVTPEDTKCSQ